MARKSRKTGHIIRVGIVGMGIGRVHAQGYSKCPRVELTAFCDLDAKRAECAAEVFGVKRIYTDFQAMLAEENLDAVSICTPNVFHAPMSIAALEAGCHVLCEKPIALNAGEAKAILEAVRKAKTKFMVAMNNRFRGDTQVLKEYVEEGTLGEIYYAKCGWVRRNGIPGMGSWFTQKEMSGGGPLVDLGVHALDLALYLMGCPKPVAAFGATYAKFGPMDKSSGGWRTPKRGGGFDVEDLAVGQVRFENGATLVLEASWAQHCAGERLYCELYGDKGGATLEPLRIYTDHKGEPVDISPHVPQINSYEAEFAHFVSCITEDRPPLSTVEQALDVMKIVDAVYQSCVTGTSVEIK